MSVTVEFFTIREVARRIGVAAGPSSRVLLFGSHARGEARHDSDLDFLVVQPGVADRGAEAGRLRAAVYDYRLPMDILVIGEADIANPSSPVVAEGLASGIVLYEHAA